VTTTTQNRAQAMILAARAKSRAEARRAQAPASVVIQELTEDVINLAETVDVLCAALGEAEFRRP